MKILVPLAKLYECAGSENTNGLTSLLEINKKPIIQYIYEKYNSIDNAEFIFIIKKEDNDKYHLSSMIKLLNKDNKVVIAYGDTKGAACTCMLAIEYLINDESLLIISGEHYLNEDVNTIMKEFEEKNLDGGIVTFKSIHPRWSYVRLDKDSYVIETAEKRPISHYATTGVYYFKKSSYFVESTKQMILKDASVEGRFYICPVYNEMILSQRKIGIKNVNSDNYFSFSNKKGLEEFETFLKNRGKVCC